MEAPVEGPVKNTQGSESRSSPTDGEYHKRAGKYLPSKG